MNFDLNPNIEPFDLHARTIRRNLMVTSITGIILSIKSISIDFNASSLLGVHVSGLEQNVVIKLVLGFVLYHFLYFGWIVYNHRKEQIFKVTGFLVPKAKAGTYAGGHEFETGTNEQRQSTLVSWWHERTKKHSELDSFIRDIEGKLKNQKEIESLGSIKSAYAHLEFENMIISEALARYQKGFILHTYNQRVRWCLFDCGVPLFLGIVAILVLIDQLTS